jgi:hypothetical protein
MQCVASADSASNDLPKTPTFDQSTVQKMLSSIDEGHNYPLLKVWYFGGHVRSSFPAIKGFGTLKSTLDKQEMGTLHWFQLESIKGFAAFHIYGIPTNDGYDAYGLIFDGSFLATNTATQRIVQISVRDFVVSVFTSKGLSSDSRTQSLLLKAWEAWHKMPQNESSSHLSIDWGRAVKSAQAQNRFTAIVEKKLNDNSSVPDITMLKLAVVVLQNREPKRAIDLLKIAQRKLQPDDHYNQKWLYETWTQLITGIDPQEQGSTKITNQKVLVDLAEMRKDQISYTGTGYADLLKLYWQLGKNDKANDLIKVAKGSGIRASQKIDVAKVLLRPPADFKFSKETTSQLQEQGVSLLQAYLTSSEKLQPNDEIRARYELGRYFIKQDQITEALQTLDIGDLKSTSRYTETAMYYAQILKMKAQLAKKLKDVDGVK